MKKIFLMSLLCLSNQLFAQIDLPQNKSLSQMSNKKQLPEIIGYGKYNATIIGYGIGCNFSKDDNKIIYDYYFNNLNQYNLSVDEKDIISKSFDETLAQAKQLGVANSKMTCDSFKIQFDKIVDFIKKNNTSK